jgi:DNA-nicking Smr family endonuclease|tara:strand:+ start:22 stop:435 length:414 start_codon:yes stop_codon:yes gene_type:complete
LNSKLTDKDKKDWRKFTSSRDKVSNKDFKLNKKNIEENTKRIIDLHGFSLENANKIIEEFINNSYQEGIKKIIVVTGKGTRSKTANNPYLSRDLSILKHSVPEFIKSNSSLMNKIKQISEANIEDGGSGAFYIYFKN